jgi:hypothetical protein
MLHCGMRWLSTLPLPRERRFLPMKLRAMVSMALSFSGLFFLAPGLSSAAGFCRI